MAARKVSLNVKSLSTTKLETILSNPNTRGKHQLQAGNELVRRYIKLR